MCVHIDYMHECIYFGTFCGNDIQHSHMSTLYNSFYRYSLISN